MQSKKFNAQESLELISQIIEEAKSRFEENGFIYLFWGVLIGVAAFSQYALIQNKMYLSSWYPYLLVPFGVLFSVFYYRRKKKNVQANNQISNIIFKVWISIGINMMVLAFIFAPLLAENLSPIILILLALGILVSAVSLKSNVLFVSSIFINISGIITFKVDWEHQSLILGSISLIAVAIPGLIMMNRYKRRNKQSDLD